MDEVERTLHERTALLCLDEFETLLTSIANGQLAAEDVLGLLRHLVQHRRRFSVLIAASQSIEELQRWATYLVNMPVVRRHISRRQKPVS